MGTPDGLAGIDVLILAGGRGTRLASLPGDVPKPLRPVGGRPFLDRLFDQVRAAGGRRVVLALGHAPEAFRAHLAARPPDGLEVSLSVESAPLGTGGALRAALPALRSDPVLVMNGDSYVRADLGALVAAHRRRAAAATILLSAVDDASRFGAVETGPSGEVVRFREKAASGPGLVNAGVYVFGASAVAALPPGRPLSLERDVLPPLAGRGLFAVVVDRPFVDIGTPESYRAAEAFFQEPERP